MNILKKTILTLLILSFGMTCSSVSNRMMASVGIGCLAGLAVGAAVDASKDKASANERKQLQNQIGAIFKKQKSDPAYKGKIVGLGAGCLAGLGVGYYLDTMAEDMEAQLKAAGMTVEKIPDSAGETKELLIKAGENSITFKPDSTELTPDSEPKIAKIAEAIKGYDETKIRVGGHVSAVKKDAVNTKLSQDRADAVTAKLSSMGVESGRIAESKGFANEKPLPGVKATDPKNRRVEIFVMAAN